MATKILTGNMDFKTLAHYTLKPELDEPGEAAFWNDPYISQQMLKAHLDPSTDAASRKPETIDRCVEWIIRHMNLQNGSRFLDLGCGPGLYTIRLARRGFKVTGMDFSPNSLDFARLQACQENLSIDYILQDYLTIDYDAEFDAASLIYFDLGVFSKANRERLLPRIARALKPGGHFAFDVVTGLHHSKPQKLTSCEVFPSGGFWRPGPHMVLSQAFHYPEDMAYVDRYLVIDESGNLAVYNVWEHYFTTEMIRAEICQAGFSQVTLWSDLTGTLYDEHAGSIGVMAKK
jgi:SAM-dependent methyltransferase